MVSQGKSGGKGIKGNPPKFKVIKRPLPPEGPEVREARRQQALDAQLARDAIANAIAHQAYYCRTLDEMIDILKSQGIWVELYNGAKKRMERKWIRTTSTSLLISDCAFSSHNTSAVLDLSKLLKIEVGLRDVEEGSFFQVTTAFVFSNGSLCVRFKNPDTKMMCKGTEALCHQAFQALYGIEVGMPVICHELSPTPDCPQQGSSNFKLAFESFKGFRRHN